MISAAERECERGWGRKEYLLIKRCRVRVSEQCDIKKEMIVRECECSELKCCGSWFLEFDLVRISVH